MAAIDTPQMAHVARATTLEDAAERVADLAPHDATNRNRYGAHGSNIFTPRCDNRNVMMSQPDLQHPIAAAGSERRTGKRHSLVLLMGKVLDPAGAHACLVHDVSPTGLMGRFTKLPVTGQPICIEIRGLPPIDATVRWVKGFKAGIEFDQRQDVDCVFKVKRDDGLIARAPRFPVSAPASLRIGAQRIKAEALDISPGGAKLFADISVQRGQAGQVLLTETGTALFGTVCWAYDGRFGFKFVAPLPLTTLSEILANQQAHLAAAE